MAVPFELNMLAAQDLTTRLPGQIVWMATSHERALVPMLLLNSGSVETTSARS